MTAYVWESLETVSNHWHSGGGLLVVADSDDRAKALIAADGNAAVSDEEWLKVIRIPTLDSEQERVITFPDAGCC